MAPPAGLDDIHKALNLNQRELGEALGYSRRTINRWTGNDGWRNPTVTRGMAALLLPVDRPLAERVAAICGQTLESLGLAKAPPPAPPPPPVKQPMPRAIDVVVCAAADAMDGTPRQARAALLAAIRAAREMELGLEEIEAALGAAPDPRPLSDARPGMNAGGSEFSSPLEELP